MDIDRFCNVCKEDASYFCRMCSLHFCSEHLCLHLNVAWEANSWTHRNTEDYDEDQGVREDGNGRFEQCVDEPIPRTDLQNTPKPLPAYTEAELQSQYKFYLSQARRIRTELERRAISLQSPEEAEVFQHLQRNKNRVLHSKRKRSLPISASRAVSVLLDSLRHGNISLEYIKAQMQLPPEQP